nr:MAG TPA: hypothetical protein [Inoviridae sp.]
MQFRPDLLLVFVSAEPPASAWPVCSAIEVAT